MMGQDIVNNHELRRVTLAAATTGDTTLTAIDTKGYQGIVAFLLNIGTVGAADASNYLTFEAWESDDNGVADAFTQITDDLRYVTPFNYDADTNPHGNGEFVIDNTAMANTDHMFGVMLYKRYLQIRVNENGTFSGTITLNALLGGARETITAHRT